VTESRRKRKTESLGAVEDEGPPPARSGDTLVPPPAPARSGSTEPGRPTTSPPPEARPSRTGTEPAIDPDWRSDTSASPPPPPTDSSGESSRESRSAAGEIGVVEFGADLIEESKAPPRRKRSRTEPVIIADLGPDSGPGAIPESTRYERGRLPPPTSGRVRSPTPPPVSPPPPPSATSGYLEVSTQPRVQTLPGELPFNTAIRGQMIANGSNGLYFIGEHIGSGAYGDVYECTDEWDNPLVAKVLKPGLAFDEAQRQWQSEVSNLSQMRHPNITYIYDAFIYENAFYIVVEKCLYSLDRVLHRADQSWVPHIARDLLQALAFVHRLGHVHKDVHVGNVFVSVSTDVMDPNHTPRLQFKLGDLGIMRQEHDIRTVGTILAPWMRPPEAIDPAQFGTVSKPTDIYHAALLLLAVLRREIYPFSEAEIVAGAPRDFAERTGWPAAMALSNALHPNVQRRTQTPLEFWREVQSHFRG
jgi:serine/threonine-protein kinase